MKNLLLAIPASCFIQCSDVSFSKRQSAFTKEINSAPSYCHYLSTISPTRLNYAKESSSLPDSSDPYVILNVQPGADMKDIKRAYRKLVTRFHPDTSSLENKAKAAENFAKLNAAYAYLTGKSDKLPQDSDQKMYKRKQTRAQQSYTSWNNPSTRTDYHAHVKKSNAGDSHKFARKSATTKSSSHKFDPNRFISEGWFSYFDPERPSQYSSPRPPWDFNEAAYIRDFANWAQVHDLDLQGYPINGPDSLFAHQYSYENSANSDFGAVYTQRHHFDSINQENDRNYPSSDSFQGRSNVGLNYKDLVRDFASVAQVRDYDADGNPIDRNGESHHSQEILYEVVDDRFMREFEENMKKSKTKEAQMDMNIHSPQINSPSFYSDINNQRQAHHEHNQSRAQNGYRHFFQEGGSEGSLPNYMNGVNMAQTMPTHSISTHSSWNHEQISRFDIDGKSKSVNSSRNYVHHTQSDNMKMQTGERNRRGYSQAQNTRANVNTNLVQGYDIHGNPIVRDMSIYVDDIDRSFYAPDPSYVQSYDIHGNTIDRPSNSAKRKIQNSVYHQPGRI